jgi:hypothetical protein
LPKKIYAFRVITVFGAVGLAAVLLVLNACSGSDGSRNIRDYYFPVLDLQDGKVYAYDLVEGDSSAPEYWYFRGFVRDSGIFLTSTYYNRDFRIGQLSREKIVESGALTRDYFLYETDSASDYQIQVPVQLDATNVFPFKVRDSTGVFLFSLRYVPPSDTLSTIYLIRNRRFLGDGPGFQFLGKTYPTVRFHVQEVIGNEREGSAEVEGTGEEWYAKGLGLVYYRKSYGQGGQISFAYRLKEIFDMIELERRSR